MVDLDKCMNDLAQVESSADALLTEAESDLTRWFASDFNLNRIWIDQLSRIHADYRIHCVQSQDMTSDGKMLDLDTFIDNFKAYNGADNLGSYVRKRGALPDDKFLSFGWKDTRELTDAIVKILKTLLEKENLSGKSPYVRKVTGKWVAMASKYPGDLPGTLREISRGYAFLYGVEWNVFRSNLFQQILFEFRKYIFVEKIVQARRNWWIETGKIPSQTNNAGTKQSRGLFSRFRRRPVRNNSTIDPRAAFALQNNLDSVPAELGVVDVMIEQHKQCCEDQALIEADGRERDAGIVNLKDASKEVVGQCRDACKIDLSELKEITENNRLFLEKIQSMSIDLQNVQIAQTQVDDGRTVEESPPPANGDL